MSGPKVAVVVGVGPGLGAAVARRFAREGFAVALMARNGDKLAPVKAAIVKDGGRAEGFPCDAADPASLRAAFKQVAETLGAPAVLVYNVSAFQLGGVLEITAEQLEQCFHASCTGALVASQQVLPSMIERKRGTILFTGATASLRGSARFACLATAKFALRALAQSMARELSRQGVHVAHVVVDGQIASDRARTMSPGREEHTMLSPEAIAETYWQLHLQDPTAWTHELDVRPNVETF